MVERVRSCGESAVNFLFSSSRRHTRYWRDWSSDVCSSDLEELRLEGLARELVRAIQDRRKKLGLNVEDRIDTRYEADGMLVRAVQRHGDYIKSETLSKSLEQGRADDFNGEQLMLE